MWGSTFDSRGSSVAGRCTKRMPAPAVSSRRWKAGRVSSARDRPDASFDRRTMPIVTRKGRAMSPRLNAGETGMGPRHNSSETRREICLVAMNCPSAMRAVCAASVLLLAQSACRSEPVNPQELLAAHALGLNYLQRGQLPEAEAEFRKVTSLAPRDPIGHANLGLTYLRGERFREAETALRRAQRLNDKNADVGLILAKLYSLTDRPDEARTTLERLPRDARVLYALAELETAGGRELSDTAALRRYHDRLVEVQRAAPANLAVRIRIADVLARRGVTDSAAVQLEEIGRIRPEPPAQARPHLDSALQHLRRGTVAEARAPLDRFLRAMELTAPYQSSLDEVKWEQGPLVGRPVLAFNLQSLMQTRAIPGGGPAAPA